jgi:hypothetical protein
LARIEPAASQFQAEQPMASCGRTEQIKPSKLMKELNRLFDRMTVTRALATASAVLVAVGLLALVTSTLPTPAHAQAQVTNDSTQVAQLDQLLADFHGALSYGGHLDAMMDIWADNSSITLNGTAHVGKDAVMAFFTSGGYFHNDWVSLAPEFKTQITIHGDIAEASTQCIATDISVSPFVVKSVIQVNAVAQKIDGKWVFVSMNNTTPAPL